MKRRLAACLFVLAAMAVGGGLELQATARLNRERDAALRDHRQLAALRTEHERLARAQLSPAARDALLRDAAEANRLRHEIATRTPAAAPAAADSPPAAGDTWVTAAAWQNRGRATPTAALETGLWAAANADVRLLRDTMELAPDARAALQALLAGLDRHHASAPAAYATPEDLAALFTARDAQAESMRVVWSRSPDPDHAIEAVLLKTADGKTKETAVSLHRTDDGWHLVLPFAYAKKISDELAGRPTAALVDRAPPQR